MNIKICLDPGHNATSRGVDSGATGFGLLEQNLTLDIAKRLKTLLQYNGFTVIMTREGDYVVGNYNSVTGSLQARCDISNKNNVDFYISLHINAGGGTGVEIYVSQFGGNAEKCAKLILPYLVSAGQWTNRGVKTARDYVLLHTDASAILIEHGFIDSKNDATKLADSNFRQSLAVADCKGICDYFGIKYKEQLTSTIQSTPIVKTINNQGDDNVLEKAVLLYSKDDYFAGGDVALKYNCAIFIRPADKSCPKEAFSSKQLFVIGGSSVKHPNEILLSGNNKFDTCAAVNKFLGQ